MEYHFNEDRRKTLREWKPVIVFVIHICYLLFIVYHLSMYLARFLIIIVILYYR